MVVRCNASVQVRFCAIAACLFAGARSHEDGRLILKNSSLAHCGLALGLYGNSFVGVYGCCIYNLTNSGALHTEGVFTRTVCLEVMDSTLKVGRVWTRGGALDYGHDKVLDSAII